MANTHVLNRGPAAVRSPADRLFVPDGNRAQPSAGSPPAEIDCRRPQSIPVRSNAPLASLEEGTLVHTQLVDSYAETKELRACRARRDWMRREPSTT